MAPGNTAYDTSQQVLNAPNRPDVPLTLLVAQTPYLT